MIYKSKLAFSASILILILAIQGSYAQNKINTDSLSNDIIENVYKEEPNTKKADSLRSNSFNAYPYAFYTPESQLAFGAGGIYIFYGGKETNLRPSKIGFGGYYSTNKQYKLSVNPNLYFFGNKLYVEIPTSFGYFINKFWGIGDDVPDYDLAAYAMQTFSSTLTIQVPPKIFAADRTGVIFDFDQTEIVDVLDNELINEEVSGFEGGTLFGFGTDLVWDSRDNIFFPNEGSYQYFKMVFYPKGPSDFNFALLQLDVKAFKAIAPDHVFAFNFFIESASGNTPFYRLPSLGGPKRMRGFFNGRYRDNFYGMMQLEYRQYFWKRFGFVVFGGTGNVANSILEYDFGTLKWSYGAGLRFKFNEKQKVNLRMDIGFGSDGSRGIYFGIQEAF